MQLDTVRSYHILGLEPGASAERVRKAYLELVHTWDPERHVLNPVLLAETQKKRREIDEAYQTIQAFLPDLRSPSDDVPHAPSASRDFEELAVKPETEISRAMMGVLAAVVFVLIFAFAYYLYSRGMAVTPAPHAVEPVIEDPASEPSPSAS